MKKSFFILSVVVLVTVSLCIYYVKANEEIKIKGVTLQKAFEKSGAVPKSSEVYCWGAINKKYSDLNSINTFVESIMSSFDVVRDNTFNKQEIESELSKHESINGVTRDGRDIKITMHMGRNPSVKEEGYISVSITQSSSYDKLDDTKRELLKVFMEHEINAQVNTSITGYYHGKLDDYKLNDISKKILKGVEAKKVEGISDESYLSVSAYSPYMGRHIKVNGKRVNLNYASRYNSYEGKTYIWFATPVITTEY